MQSQPTSPLSKEISFWLLVLLFLSASMGIAATANAGTLVKADGEISERTYKSSYLVKNKVVLEDIRVSKKPEDDGTEWVVDVHPGSSLRTKRRPSSTVMGDLA